MYLDEANMMKQDVATRLNPVLDTRGHLVLNEKDSEVIERHKYGYMIISMNPATAEFSGTKPLNAAMRRRMAVWINFDFLSVGEKISPHEVEMLRKRTKVDQDVAYKIIQAGAELRIDRGTKPRGQMVPPESLVRVRTAAGGRHSGAQAAGRVGEGRALSA
jgi:nitric oxide reductase NorQ protein